MFFKVVGKIDLIESLQAQALDGPNKGYRFPGSGSAAYSTTSSDSVCSYGGLVYAYMSTEIRFWRPTDIKNGGVICIAGALAEGMNAQSSSNAEVVVHIYHIRSSFTDGI